MQSDQTNSLSDDGFDVRAAMYRAVFDTPSGRVVLADMEAHAWAACGSAPGELVACLRLIRRARDLTAGRSE